MARTGIQMSSGAVRLSLTRPTWGNTITNHRMLSFHKDTMPDGSLKAGAGFGVERFAGQAKRVGCSIWGTKNPGSFARPEVT